MNFLNEMELQRLITIVKPESLQEPAYIALEGERLQTLFNYYLLLTKCPDVIIHQIPGISKDELLYNRYYWFIKFKNEYCAIHGYDAGMEQQALELLEEVERELADGIDWSIIEEIEKDEHHPERLI